MNEDLWTLAATDLTDEDKAGLDLNPSINLSGILQSVEGRKQECIDKQWTVRRGENKNAVVLRDIFAKIAVWINKFMMVGDIAVQYDPVHAALPWALIRFLLKVSVESVNQYSVIAEGVEYITLALTRYNIVERLYLRRSNESTTCLRNGLTELYTCILRFLIIAQRFYERSTAQKVLENFSSKISRHLNDIIKQEEKVKEYIHLVDAEYCGDVERTLDNLSLEQEKNFSDLKGILQDLQQPINRMERDLQTLHDGFTKHERNKILQWISAIPYVQHHNQAKRDVLAGTGAWFLNDEKVLRWLSSSSSSIMWLHGIAGSGKSKLMSIFVEMQQHDANRERNPRPIYFYCTRDPAERERANPDAILRGLVRQLACSASDGTILEPVKELYRSREQDGFAAGPLTLDESTALIIELSQDRPLTTIIIDALDECDLSSRGDLLEALSKILQDSRSLVRLLVSSRADADIVCHFSDCPNLQLEASQNQEDIDYYVKSEVEDLIKRKKLLRGNVSENLKRTIQSVLSEQAKGMFRWVSLQLQYLCLIIKDDTVWKRLGELPATLRDLYNETYVERLGNYAEDDRQTAEAILRLLMCLREPLKTKSFLLALEYYGEESTSITTEVLLDLCANFVVLDTELDVFRFAHLSVREFLERKKEFDAASWHAVAAECCLRYLLNVKPRYEVSTEDGWMTEDEDDQNDQHRAIFWDPCHEYTCLYWPFHLSESSAHRHGPPLEALFWDFMLDDQNSVTRQFKYWVDLMKFPGKELRLLGWDNHIDCRLCSGEVSRLHDDVCEPANLAFVACAWNFCDVLQYCISMDLHVVYLESSGCLRTPLDVACEHGNVEAAKLLLDNGAETDVMDEGAESPMRQAIRSGHTTIVRLLLDNGANPHSEQSYGYDTYLCDAAWRDSIDIVESLLDAGADPDWVGEYAKTALDMAIYNANLAMVRMLLESSGHTNEVMHIPWIRASQLMRAVDDGDEAGVRGILRGWPTGKLSDRYLDLALWRAASLNQKASIQLLLAKGADMESQFRGYPVLFAAATSPHTCIWLDERKFPLVQFLLRQGANPDVSSDSGPTLLHRAADSNNSGLARILLDEGANINQAYHASSPLLAAVCSGYLDVARLLLQRGADIGVMGNPSHRDNTPHSLLYCARKVELQDMEWNMKHLLLRNKVKDGPMSWVREKKYWEMEQLLLEYGAKDGPESCPCEHEPGSCPYGHGPGVCPHELGRVEDTRDEQELFESDESQSNEVSTVESEVS